MTGRTSSNGRELPAGVRRRRFGASSARRRGRPVDFRHVSLDSDSIDPDLKPMQQQEATVGFEHQLNDVLALSIRYVHKQIDRAIEDTGALDAQTAPRSTSLATPVKGLPLTRSRIRRVAIPKAVRDYDSVEFAAEKRFANNWFLRGSYMWSRLLWQLLGSVAVGRERAHQPERRPPVGLPDHDVPGRRHPALGPLATDRPHQLKAAVHLPVQLRYEHRAEPVRRQRPAGDARSRHLSAEQPPGQLSRPDERRATPTFSQTDMLVQHSFRVGGGRQLQFSLNVLNLFNQDTATRKFSRTERPTASTPDRGALLRRPADARCS